MGPRIISSKKNIIKSTVSIQKLIFQYLRKYGIKTHLVEYETGKRTTFSELLSDCLRLGAALLKLNVKPGDVIIIYGFNSYEFLVAFISGLLVGATMMSMRALDTHYEVKSTILTTEAKYLFVTAEKRETAEFIGEQLPEFKNIIIFESETDAKYLTLKQLIDNCDDKLNEEDIYEPKDENEVALILESSGTSGPMKAIMLCHYDLATALQPENILEPFEDDVYCAHSHIAHLSALNVHLRSIIFGKKLISLRRSDVLKLMDAIEKYHITQTTVTPTMLNLMVKAEQEFDLSSLRKLIIGGSRVAPKVIKAFREKYSNVKLCNGYTMTEITVLTTIGDTEFDTESIGKVCPGIQMKVINQNGQILGENETGELCVKGPIKFKGYHKNKNATKEILDEEGWIHTGDIGYFDEEEKFYIVDRIKDIIKQSGYSYSPVDLEDVLLKHDAVNEAAVIGIPSGIDDEVSHAFVVLKDEFKDGRVKEEDLLHFVNKRTSKIREIKGGLHYVSELPKTDFGKIIRRKLREQFINNFNAAK